MSQFPTESVHLTSTHRPFDTRVFQKECKTLAREGIRVTLVVPHTEDEVREGVHIRAIPKPATGKERLKKTIRHVYKAALKENKQAVFHFHDSELLPHMLMLKLRGRHVIYDAHEDTPRQIKYQHWIPDMLKGPVTLFMRTLESLAGRLFDRIIVAEPIIAENFKKENTTLLHNYPILAEFEPCHAIPYETRPMHIGFAGGISEVRGIKEVVQAMGMMQSVPDARLVMAGAFYPDTLRTEVEQYTGWTKVDFKGWVSRSEIQHILGNARVGVITRHPIDRHLTAMPTKLFEYMAAGLPVVASDLPTIRPIVEAHRCGLLVDPLDPEEIARALSYLLEHPAEAQEMGQRGYEAVRDHYSWDVEQKKLLDLYRDLGTGYKVQSTE